MPRPTMEHYQNHPIPTSNLQNQHEHQNNHQSPGFRQHLQANLNIEPGEKRNEQSSDYSKKIIYVGNLRPVVTEENLCKLSGINPIQDCEEGGGKKAPLSVFPL